VLLVVVLVGGWSFWRSSGSGESGDADSVFAAPKFFELAPAQRRDQVLLEVSMQSLREQWQGRSGRELLFALSSQLMSEKALSRLLLIEVDSDTRRRAPLSVDLLADQTLASLLQGAGAYLYPIELSLLLSALLSALEVDYDVVVLQPDDSVLERLPVLAVRVRDGAQSWALNPRSCKLESAESLEPRPLAWLWAGYELLHARHALLSQELEQAQVHADVALTLASEYWPSRWMSAEIAVARGDWATAEELAGPLLRGELKADHPAVWLLEAKLEAHQAGGEDAGAWAARLQRIVQAFPFEARLAVMMGQSYEQVAMWEQARDAYELALERDPRVEGARTGLARLYLLADPDRAQRWLREELQLHPRYAFAYLVMSVLHAARGESGSQQRMAEQGRLFSDDETSYAQQLASLLNWLDGDDGGQEK
jgi:tetratricopeptide (TPR) repeat protein